MMYLTVAVALVDAAMAGVLLLVYMREYTKLRAPFTLGLVSFAGFFLAQNLLAAYGYLVLMVFLPDDVQPLMLAIMLLEALALGVMVYGAAAVRSKSGHRDTAEKAQVRPPAPHAGASIRLPGGKAP